MDVVFAVMPFADVHRPAMGVSLLKAAAVAAGFSCRIVYCNVTLAERIGLDLYSQLSDALPPDLLAGEAFFADDVFGDAIPEFEEYAEKVLARMSGQTVADDLRRARRLRTQYLDDCVREIIAHAPRIVGFTSTFHQTCGSLAVARRLKALPNPPIVLFGGANCEGEMGLQMIQSFPWIDYVCSGESDLSFPRLLEELVRGLPPRPIPGVLRRGAATVERSPAVQRMDDLPMPDFDEFFERLERTTLERLEGCLTIETSRGCWWGAKHHCTFCGLNGDTMTFRSKSPERAFDELAYLSRRHQVRQCGCVDNILDMRYIETLFPRLAESGLDLNLFYEVKANLRYDQLATLRRGGVRQIQPGIESFSNEVLRLMEKGCSATQNVQLLRWCDELDVDASWNLLAGFPGESPAEYDRMAALVPLLTHLKAPCSCTPIRLDRFSPFHARAEAHGFRRVRPTFAYYYAFPLGRRELARLAYFFEFDYEDGRDPSTYLDRVRREVNQWWQLRAAPDADRPTLDARVGETRTIVTDTRPVARAPRHELRGVAATVFARCDIAAPLPALLRLPELAGREEETRAALASLCERGLVAEIDGHYVSLAVFRDRPPAMRQSRRHADIPLPQAAAPEPLLRVV